MEFIKFGSIARISRDMIITEKLDGTNAQICIDADGNIQAGSRNRWLTVEDDNYGFAKWVEANKEDLLKLGEGRHFGEWWGQGIQIKYGLSEKRFSLFNIGKWNEETKPECCHTVPILYRGEFSTVAMDTVLHTLKTVGSAAAPGFMKPEGIVIYHKHSGTLFKKTIKGDEAGKSYGR